MEKLIVILLKKSELLSSLSLRLVKLTGKSKTPIHPKHLVKSKVWYEKYLGSKDVILDLGAGSCNDALKISSKVKKIFCLDIDENLLNLAKNSIEKVGIHNITLKHFDAENKLPFKNHFFDKIICSDVLEHLRNRNYAILEIKRVLKKDGKLLLVTDNPNTSWKKLLKKHNLFFYSDSDHKYEYPREEILNTLQKNGFKILNISTVTFDTPLKGLIDLTGGISLSVYKRLSKWKQDMVLKHPHETSSYKIIAKTI